MDIKFFPSFDITYSYNKIFFYVITSHMCKEIGKSNFFKENFKVKNCEEKNWANISLFDTGIPHFSKVHVIPLTFTKDLLKEIWRRLSLLQKKRQKVKTAQNLFWSKHSKQQ